MYLFICIVSLETNIVFVLRHVLQPWHRSMKNQWNEYKFYSTYSVEYKGIVNGYKVFQSLEGMCEALVSSI
jgi:hypothetical protein